MKRRIQYNKFGLTENPIGMQVAMPYKGRTLLGDVLGVEADTMRGYVFLHVRHFNGEMWPINPSALSVEVLGAIKP